MQSTNKEAKSDLITVDRSLGSIKEAQGMLQNLRCAPATPDIIASQIHLCDVLLHEISGIRNRLEKGVRARCPNAGLRAPHPSSIELAWPEHLQPRFGGGGFRRISASGLEPFICAGCPRPCL